MGSIDLNSLVELIGGVDLLDREEKRSAESDCCRKGGEKGGVPRGVE